MISMRESTIESSRKWIARKFEMADSIFSEYGFYGESDAEILLCCAINALASRMWPGKSEDKKKFTEFLIKFAPQNVNLKIISIPVLINKLKEKGKYLAEVDLLSNSYHFGPFNEVVACSDIDQLEDEIMKICPNIAIKDIRRASHVRIIYEDLRCGLVHEGRFSNNLFHDFGEDRIVPYYANLVVDLEREIIAHPLCFPYRYIRDVIANIAENAFTYWTTANSWGADNPSKWWIDG